ncbi:MAG: glycosyltransferase [Acidobacteria bacterium]|nr:glycosyltransferase [Acidobacteriota bacterium]
MKILYLLPESPYPPQNGPQHHTYGLLRIAAERYECHVAGFYCGEEGQLRWRQLQENLPNLQIHLIVPELKGAPRFIQRLLRFLRCHPLIMAGYVSPALVRWANNFLQENRVALIHVDQFKLAHFWRIGADIPHLLIPYDAFSLAASRDFKLSRLLTVKARALYKLLSFTKIERKIYPRFSMVSPVSQVDVKWLTSRSPHVNATVIEIPVPDEFFSAPIAEHQETAPPHIICAGLFNWDAVAQGAIRFFQEAVPLIRQQFPQTRFSVWGPPPTAELQAVIAQIPQVDCVNWVEDYSGMLKSAAVYVYPQTCGSGMQTKVQQAMALGIPVIACPESLDPLYVTSESQAFVCTKPTEMAEAAIRLLKSAKLRNEVGAAAREHMKQHFSLHAVARRLDSVYQTVSS